MRVDDAGLRFIAEFEGFRGELYNDPVNHCTIGFGHLVHRGPCNGLEPEEFRRGLSEQQALSLLSQDVARFEQGVMAAVTVPLGQNQFNALVSFVYNIGLGAFKSSRLLRLVNDGKHEEVPQELLRWNKAGDRELPGLTRRRGLEAALYAEFDNPLPPVVAPLPPLRYDKLAFVLEHGARTLRDEGFPAEHDFLMGSPLYQFVIHERDTAPRNFP